MSPQLPPGILGDVARRRIQVVPTRRAALLFGFKAACFRLRRALWEGNRAPRALPQRFSLEPVVLAESRSPLYSSGSAAEWALQAGKVQNLRVAARSLHGRMAAARETFSFWANVGRATRARGFVRGRELREGCVIPNIGGGLCQLSNSLYEAALLAGFEILERHPHSRPVPDSHFRDRDATVFWNYVDLRFRASVPFQIAVELTAGELRVRLLAPVRSPLPTLPADRLIDPGSPGETCETCETCGVADCFRHAEAAALPRPAGTAWFVDAFQPELDQWLHSRRGRRDALILPIESRRLNLGPYRWTTTGFASVRSTPVEVLRRSLASRRLATQGAARQRRLLEMDETLARAFARKAPPLATHLVISQNLLPFLWRDGFLGGRTFEVLMTRWPLGRLEAILDAAARRHPESPTLGDFRAPAEIVELERAALAAANRWITPHAGIAALAGDRAELLDWQLPRARPLARGRSVIFPASTLGRKGAYELREALRELPLPLRYAGPVIERPDFWRGLEAMPTAAGNWLEDAAVVALPAWVEYQPRRLLQAVSAGIPVVTSDACGLRSRPGVMIVPAGDTAALREAVETATG